MCGKEPSDKTLASLARSQIKLPSFLTYCTICRRAAHPGMDLGFNLISLPSPLLLRLHTLFHFHREFSHHELVLAILPRVSFPPLHASSAHGLTTVQ